VINPAIVSTILFASFTLLQAAPTLAQGEIIITQAKANAGNVTPGDAAGFPVTLSLPGAYVLGSNLTVSANKTGLSVTSHNVDIDMNGFRLHGAGVASYGVVSIRGESHIHGGVISSFKLDGIFPQRRRHEFLGRGGHADREQWSPWDQRGIQLLLPLPEQLSFG